MRACLGLAVHLSQELPEVGLRMGWHSSKEEPQLLHLFNGDTTFNRLLQKGPSLLLLWDSGEVLPPGTQPLIPA